MDRDPIVEEVHRVRERMWDDWGATWTSSSSSCMPVRPSTGTGSSPKRNWINCATRIDHRSHIPTKGEGRVTNVGARPRD
jgi:hypothetical protein